MEIRCREGYLFGTFRCGIHAGSDDVNLTAAKSWNQRIEAETLYFCLFTDFFGNGFAKVDIKTYVLIVFRKFKGRERRFHADDKGVAFFLRGVTS